MKKKIFLIADIAAFAVTVAFNINANMNNNAKTNMVLANVEALVHGEIEVGALCAYDFGTCIWIIDGEWITATGRMY